MLVAAWLVVVQTGTGSAASWALTVVAALLLLAGLAMSHRGSEGWGFSLTFAAIGIAVISLFVALFPDVMPSSTDAAFSLTTTNASSTDYTLKIMTWIAVLVTPVVLLYQSWTYWIFRKRVSGHHIPTEVALAARRPVAAGRADSDD